MIGVMIVDDQDIIRAGLRMIVEHQDDLRVISEVADGFGALEALSVERPDVILMDIHMPGIDGVEVTRRIRAQPLWASIRILVLTTFERDENVLTALRAGADGFLGKGAGPGEILESIRSVATGGHALSSAALGSVIDHVSRQPSPPPRDPAVVERFGGLTPREREVVEALVRGDEAELIARSLFLSPYTVKTHVNRAMSKVGARDRAQLVSFAVQAGILPWS